MSAVGLSLGNVTDYDNLLDYPVDNPGEDGNLVGYCGAAVIIVLLVTGAVGNAIVLISIIRIKRLHLADNVLIASLAVTDLAFNILIMPFYVDTYINQAWRYSHVICVMETYTGTLMVMASAYHIALIALHRYLHIVHPTTFYPKISRISAIIAQIGVIWLICFLIVLPGMLGWQAKVGYSRQIGRCNYIRTRSKGSLYLIFGLGFILPCLAMIVCYTLIAKTVEYSSWKLNSYSEKRTSHAPSRDHQGNGHVPGMLMTSRTLDEHGADAMVTVSRGRETLRYSSDATRSEKNHSANHVTDVSISISGSPATSSDDKCHLPGEKRRKNDGVCKMVKSNMDMVGVIYADVVVQTGTDGVACLEVVHHEDRSLPSNVQGQNHKQQRGESSEAGEVGETSKQEREPNNGRLAETRISSHVKVKAPADSSEAETDNLLHDSASDSRNPEMMTPSCSEIRHPEPLTSSYSIRMGHRYQEKKENHTDGNSGSLRLQSNTSSPDVISTSGLRHMLHPHHLPGGHHRHHTRSLRMILAIFLAFIATYLPFAVINLVDARGSLRREWYMISSLFFWAGACVNPIIYGLMNSHFLEAYRDVLLCRRS